MRSMKINRDWEFGLGPVDLGKRLRGIFGDRKVSLPHDYMIGSDVYADAPSGPASGYYNAGVVHYAKEIDIPADWENDQVSRTRLATTGKPAAIRLTAETEAMTADGVSLCYVNAELIDQDGNVVPDADALLKAEVTGAAELLGFGSGNPITDENYSKGRFTSYQGKALAVLRAGYEAGEAKLTVSADGLEKDEIRLQVK